MHGKVRGCTPCCTHARHVARMHALWHALLHACTPCCTQALLHACTPDTSYIGPEKSTKFWGRWPRSYITLHHSQSRAQRAQVVLLPFPFRRRDVNMSSTSKDIQYITQLCTHPPIEHACNVSAIVIRAEDQ